MPFGAVSQEDVDRLSEFANRKPIWQYRKRTEIMKRLVVALTALALTNCGIPGGAEISIQARQYSGDGQIRTCSNSIEPGFAIDFPPFDASAGYTKSYHLSKVPQVYRSKETVDPILYLRFAKWKGFGDPDKIKIDATASFRVVLSKSTGEVVKTFTLTLASSIWTVSQNLIGVYDLEKSKVHFERGGAYVLHVEYTPGTNPPLAKKLYFALDDCAFY
jgi:hypothetical protein